MKRPLVVVAGAVLVPLLACASILGIEELPIAKPDAGEVVLPDAADATPDVCVDDFKLGCGSCVKHAFCDDFDDDAGVGKRWISDVTPEGGVLRTVAGIDVTKGAAISSSPFALETNVDVADGAHLGGLVHQPTGKGKNAGVRLRFIVTVRTLSYQDGGPVENNGGAILGALFNDAAGTAGVALVATKNRVYLALLNNIFTGTGSITPKSIISVDTVNFTTTGVAAEVVVTTRDRAIAEGDAQCASIADPTVAVVRLGGLAHACSGLQPILGDLRWAERPFVFVGAGSLGSGDLRVLHDNVTVDFFD